MTPRSDTPHIGTLAERSLHAAIKDWYARPGDQVEARVEGYVIDLIRGETLVEIQTGNFSAIKRKLTRLLLDHDIHLVYPIPQERWVVRQTAAGQFLARRKSPKRGQVLEIFTELVRLPELLPNPRLTLIALLIQEETIWRDDGQGSWRRKGWSLHDRRLLGVLDQRSFNTLPEYLALLPPALPQPFTNLALAAALGCRLTLARKLTYTLRRAGGLQVSGKSGNALLFETGHLAGG